jgi:hypothetical protein
MLKEHDRVYDQVDPRHIGKVISIMGDACIIQWTDRPNMLSILNSRHLKRVAGDVDGLRERIEERLVVEVSTGQRPGEWYAEEAKHFLESYGPPPWDAYLDEAMNAFNLVIAEIAKRRGLSRH